MTDGARGTGQILAGSQQVPNDCDSAADEMALQRRHRGLSIEWREYPGTGIEVFHDNCAVLYRINGQIYAVPRQLVQMPFNVAGISEEDRVYWENGWMKPVPK